MTATRRIVLALDLSTPRGVIAVLRGEDILYHADFTAERSHNAQLFAPLQAALQAVDTAVSTDKENSSVIIVTGTGPGSYTGVRIAIAAAQGVALSRGWPLIGLPTLATAPATDCHILGDARRGQFYTVSVKQHQLGPIRIMDADSARAELATGGIWYSFDNKPPLGLEQIPLCQPDAAALAHIAADLPEEEVQALAAQPLEPLYLQEAFITTAKKAGKAVPREQ